MVAPTRMDQMGLGVIRGAFSRGAANRCVVIVDTGVNLIHPEVLEMSAFVPAGERGHQYWVLQMRNNMHDYDAGTSEYTFNDAGISAVGRGFANYDDAEDQFDAWAKSQAGHTTTRRGVYNVGREEA